MFMVHIGNDWDNLLAEEFKKDYYLKLREFLKKEYSSNIVYPDMNDIFNSFKRTSYSAIKAVIIGQDPYHGIGQAQGLCFSVPDNIEMPPSLVNIFKELSDDLNIPIPKSGCLYKWADQGVMLLNTVLTVRKDFANSHKGYGWETFTDNVISLINKKEDPVVFILWGANARSKKPIIDCNKHLIIESAHPSPLSCYNGFFKSKPFSKTNEFLKKYGKSIDWTL
jgi:uracil-DNA glycosylase